MDYEIKDVSGSLRARDSSLDARLYLESELRACWRDLTAAISQFVGGGEPVEMLRGLANIDDLLVGRADVDSHLNSLVAKVSFPEFSEISTKQDLAICAMVVEIWARIRFSEASLSDLVEEYSKPPFHQQDYECDFVRAFLVYGGLKICSDCGEALPPRDIESSCCDRCVGLRRRSISALDIAIGCDASVDSAAQNPLEVHRFPQWKMWRRRLRGHLGIADATDAMLLEEWKCYVLEQYGMDEERFLAVSLQNAEVLLPPSSSQPMKRDFDTGNRKHLRNAGAGERQRTVSQVARKDLAKYHDQAKVVTAWIKAGKPKRHNLATFLAEETDDISVVEWARIRSNARSTARRYGYTADEIPLWFAALEKEVQLRENAGIFIREY